MDNLQLWYRLHKDVITTSGALPLAFEGNGDYLTSYTICGHTSPNLFDQSAVTENAAIDNDSGEITESEGEAVTDFIPITASGVWISAGGANSGSIAYRFYDLNKAALGEYNENYMWSYTSLSYKLLSDSENAAYVRIAYTASELTNIMINAGDAALPYEPYGKVGDKTANLAPRGWEETLREYGRTLPSRNGLIRLYISSDGVRYLYISLFNTPLFPQFGLVEFKPNQQYSLSFVGGGKTQNRGANFGFKYADGSSKVITVDDSNLLPRTLTSEENKTVQSINVGAVTGWRPLNSYIVPNTLMLNEGSTPLPYEPYGYRIPVTCGGVTTNIYLDEPLGTGESVTFAQTGVKIPTVQGENTFTVGTAVQPESVSVSSLVGVKNDAAKFFDWKYRVTGGGR